MRYPEIDYGNHPAYAPFRCDLVYDEELIAQQIRAVDALHAKFCALTAPSTEDIADVRTQMGQQLERVLRHVKENNISVLAEEWLHACVDWTLADLGCEHVRRLFSSQEYKSRPLSSNQSVQVQAMENQGMYVANLPSATYEEIRRLALQYLPELKSRAMTDHFNRAVINVTFNSALWKAIKHGAKEAGILDVLSEFKRNRMTMLGAGLEYSYQGQNWYQSLYSDAGIPDGPLQYLHIDAGDSLPKSMIYVTPVDEETGPTRAIPGSNCWELSECQIRMHKALDHVVSNRYIKFARRAHYRPLARHPELRRIFMELPKPFQGSSHFGDDIVAGTQLADSLGKLEIPYLSQGAQAYVFDGPRLLHRGSLVRSGERMALQVVYRNQNLEKVRSYFSQESLFKEQLALARKYARKLAMGFV
jgi:hypothetical protein